MTEGEFLAFLRKATRLVLEHNQGFVIQVFTDRIRYRVRPCASYDGNACSEEKVFPEDRLPPGVDHLEMGEQEVISYYCREGRVPVWINISVEQVVDETTYIQLLSAGRFSRNEELLYYRECGTGPFGVKYPPTPFDWEFERDGKFDLDWDK